MNTLISTYNMKFTKAAVAALLVVFAAESVHAEWVVDFSRRVKPARETELSVAAQPDRSPASVESTIYPAPQPDVVTEAAPPKKGVFDTLFDKGEPTQDLVILNTENGFVPATVRVRANARYRVSIVNVNEKEKNVSFILDGFAEHHATYYGKVKTFTLEPKQEGSFSFQSPETGSEGKVIVFNPEISLRAPAQVSVPAEKPIILGGQKPTVVGGAQ